MLPNFTIDKTQCTAAPALSAPTTDLDRFLDAIGDERSSVAIVGAGDLVKDKREMWRYFPASGTVKREIKRGCVYRLSGPEQPLESIFKQYRGISFRPNHVGVTNETWQGSRLLFCEWDNLAIDEQWDRIQQLRDMGLAPTAIVHSGGKSLHTYIGLDRTVTDPEQWERLMRKLAIAMGSDPAICTLNREMRLPGGLRLKCGVWHEQALLETHPENRYSPEAIEAVLDGLGLFPLGLDGPRFTAWKRAKNQRKKLLDKLESGTLTPSALLEYPPQFTCEEVLGTDDWKTPVAPLPHYYSPQHPEANADRDRALILENAHLLPSQWGNPGTNTYEQARNFTWAAAAVLGDCEAEALLSPLWPQRKIGQLIRSRNGKDAGGIAYATQVFKDLGFDAKAWYHTWFERHEQHTDRPQRLTERTTPEAQKAADIASFQAWQEAARNEWLEMRRFTPDITIDSQYVELEREPGIDYHIKAGLGLGKTHYSTQEATAQLNSGGAVYFQAHRNSLLHQTLGRLDNPAVSMVNESQDAREYWDGLSSPACAPDSLPKLNLRDWGETQQHIDEAAAVVRHLLVGGTLKGNRKQAIDIARQSREECQSILALDGQLTDFASDYLAADRPVVKVEFSHKPATMNVRLIAPPEGKVMPHLPTAGILHALQEGHNCVFVADSQRDCEALDIELSNRGFSTFRYDSKTSRDPETKAIVSSPTLGEDLAAMGIRVLILSPTAEAGLDVSTTDPYFTRGFALFLGIVGTDAQVQLLRRSRQTLDWDIHCVTYRAHDDVGTHSTRTDTVYRYESENITLSLTTALVEAVKRGESLDSLLSHPAFAVASDPDFYTACKLKAARNYEASHTFECLQTALEQDGHSVSIFEGLEDPYKDQIKDTKTTIKLSEAEKIYTNCGDPVPMPEEQALAVLRGNSATLEQEYKARRTLLLASLPGVEKSDLWDAALVYDCLYRDRKLIKCLQRFWLSQHPEAHEQKDTAALGAILGGYAWAADLNHDRPRLDLMQELGLTDLVGSFEWIDDSHPTVCNAYRRIKSKALRRRAAALGLAPRRGETPTAWVLRMLRKLFNVATESQRHRQGDKVGRRYQIMNPKGWELYEFVDRGMTQLAQEKWPEQAADTLEKVIHHSPSVLKKNRGVVDHPPAHTGQGFEWCLSESVLNAPDKPKTAPSQPTPLTSKTPQTVTPIDPAKLSLMEWAGEWWWQCGDRILPSECDPDTTPLGDWLTLPKTA